MKRLAFVLAGSLVAAATAFAGPANIPTKKHGILIVGLNPPAVGFQVGTLRGNNVINPRGFEIDLAKEIAATLDNEVKTVRWINVPFSGLFAPGSKPFDLAFEEATITPQRAKVVDFSIPYFTANQGVLLSKKAKVPHTLADLKKLQVCAESTTTGLDYVQHKLHPRKQALVYPTAAAGFSGVEVGRCEAYVLDVPIIASQKKAKPGAYGPIAGQIVTNEKYGAILSKGSKLTPLVNSAIASLIEHGKVTPLQKKWFAIDFSKIPTLR